MNKILAKYNLISKPVKATIWFTICNFIVKGIAFITVPIFTRVLSTDEYGIVTIYNSFQQVLMIVATFELSLGAYNKGILKYKEKVQDYTTVILLLSTIITSIVFVFVFIFRDIFFSLTNTNMIILILTFVMFIFMPAYNCWLCRMRFIYEYKSVVIVTVVYTIITTITPLVAVIFWKSTGIIKIGVTLIAQICFCVPIYIFSLKINYRESKFYKDVVTYTIPYQLPLVFHAFSFLILGQADRVMIGSMIGNSEAAIYSVAYSVGQVIILFQTSLNQVFQPYRFKKLEISSFENIRSTTNLMVMLISLIVIGFTAIAPEVMAVLFAEDYVSAINFMPPIIISVYFIFLYNVFSDVEAYYNKTSYIMYATVIAATLNVFLNFVGIKIFGYAASAYTTLSCYVLLTIMHFLFVKKICKKQGIEEKIYDFKRMFVIGVLLIIYMVVITWVYNHMLIRYLVIAFISIVVIINREKFLLMIKHMS